MYSLVKKQADEVIITEGMFQPFIFFVKSGTLNVIRTSGRKTQILAQLGPGDFIGEMAHLGTTKSHSASVVTATDTELIQIEADKIYEVLAGNPVWMKAMLKNLVKKIEAINNGASLD
ncbi:MAG: cyclic nucleotide-binding domain-containing protein [Pseudobdellovibrio sp.]